jgi:hypothetical protein
LTQSPCNAAVQQHRLFLRRAAVALVARFAHRLKGYRGHLLQHLADVRAGLVRPQSLCDRFGESLADGQTDESGKIGGALLADLMRMGGSARLEPVDDAVGVDCHGHVHIVHRFAGIERATRPIGHAVMLDVGQAGIDIEEAVIAGKAVELNGA